VASRSPFRLGIYYILFNYTALASVVDAIVVYIDRLTASWLFVDGCFFLPHLCKAVSLDNRNRGGHWAAGWWGWPGNAGVRLAGVRHLSRSGDDSGARMSRGGSFGLHVGRVFAPA